MKVNNRYKFSINFDNATKIKFIIKFLLLEPFCALKMIEYDFTTFTNSPTK